MPSSEAIAASWIELCPKWDRSQGELAEVDGTDPQTGATRRWWLLPLLRELGWEPVPADFVVNDKGYPISHCDGLVPVHLVGWNVSIDRRQAGVAGAARWSPHGLVQEFLNHSDDHQWALLSNGRRLRVLRDNASLTRMAYVEFDLEAIFGGQDYAGFALLWTMCHRSRFQSPGDADPQIEQWVQQSGELGVRSLDHLRGQVEEALELLGRGFMAHPANSRLRARLAQGELDSEDLYRQLLRLVYRLLFLLTAESRGLLHPADAGPIPVARYRRYYSMQRIVELSTHLRGSRHGDLWVGLTALFGVARDPGGAPRLAMPYLGSRLWFEDALTDLEDAELSNEALLDAVRCLTSIRDPAANATFTVDYRSLGPEELGSVYEGLLELRPVADPHSKTFTLDPGSGHERHTTGSYYTPAGIVSGLLDGCLDPIIEGALARPDPESALLALRVVDPACGSGHFLIAAARRIARALAAVRSGDDEPPPEEVRRALREAIAHCIYGVDFNELAVELCKFTLWLESLTPGMPLSFLDHHLAWGNSLLGSTPRLIGDGLPDIAFEAQKDDDKAAAKGLRIRNARERSGQGLLFVGDDANENLATIQAVARSAELLSDESAEAISAKAIAFDQLRGSEALRVLSAQADAWCAAFLQKKVVGLEPAVTSETLRTSVDLPAISGTVRDLVGTWRPSHWHLLFPEVFTDDLEPNADSGWSGGFDLVVGNPPYLNQLETATTTERRLANLVKARWGDVAKGYADISVLFLALGCDIARADGGRVALLQPDSILSTRDAKAMRRHVLERASLESLWVAGEKVFEANVLVCAPTLRVGGERTVKLHRHTGPGFTELDPVLTKMDELQTAETWASLITEGFGIPAVELSTGRTLADICTATADFRDQYYGLAPFVVEAADVDDDPVRFPRLVTTGLIDPAHNLWGTRSTKFNKVTYDAPCVDVARLAAESELGPWATNRCVPKILLATQTKVLEAIVDPDGHLLPSVPVITVIADPDLLYHVAAVFLSAPVTAWAATQYFGAALATDALKLSAKQVLTLPAPRPSAAWDQAAAAARLAMEATDGEEWRTALLGLGDLMSDAYEVVGPERQTVLKWWADRLPAWR